MKYIVFEDVKTGLKIPVVFPDHVTHSTIKIEGAKPISAGFCLVGTEEIVSIGNGKSESLNLSSAVGDRELIIAVLCNAGMYAFMGFNPINLLNKNNMTLEQIIKQSQGEKHVYPDVFSDKCGLDIILPEDKLHAVRSWGYTKGNSKRRATLEITTFRGVSFNAIHYYGKIKIQGVNMEVDGKPGHSRMVFDDNIPLAHYIYYLKLTRPLTKEEIAEDPECWGDYYNEGDLTNCFETIEDVITLAKEVFRHRFTGEWEFYVESPYSRYDGVFNINV